MNADLVAHFERRGFSSEAATDALRGAHQKFTDLTHEERNAGLASLFGQHAAPTVAVYIDYLANGVDK